MIFFGAGSIGDLFLILVKLDTAQVKTGTMLNYYTSSTGGHAVMREMTEVLFPNVELRLYVSSDLKYESFCAIANNKLRYISPRFLRDESDLLSISQIDERIKKPGVRPASKVPRWNQYVYIHQQSGQPRGNLKRLSMRSIEETINLFPELEFVVGLAPEEDSIRLDLAANVRTFKIGGHLDPWLRVIQNAQLVITTEGFPCFLALYFGLPTVWFTRHAYVRNRIRPEWQSLSFPIVGPELKSALHRLKFVVLKRFGIYPKYHITHELVINQLIRLKKNA